MPTEAEVGDLQSRVLASMKFTGFSHMVMSLEEELKKLWPQDLVSLDSERFYQAMVQCLMAYGESEGSTNLLPAMIMVT